MGSHVALLRAVNVAGYGVLPMARLKAFFDALGFEGARTLLQTGNVVFDGGGTAPRDIEEQLEVEAEKRLGFKTTFMVCTAEELSAAVAANPFVEMARDDPGHLVMLFCKEAASADAVEALQGAIKGRELATAKGRHVYVTYPDGIGRSKVTTALIESKLGTRVTGRNWNTVLKLAELATG